jgi:hypothetical protein
MKNELLYSDLDGMDVDINGRFEISRTEQRSRLPQIAVNQTTFHQNTLCFLKCLDCLEYAPM